MSNQDVERDYVHAVHAHAHPLQCTMATYQKLAGLKKKPQGELNRHQSIIRNAIVSMGQEYLAVGDHPFGTSPGLTPRLSEVLSSVKNGRTLLEAIEAWFNKVRYGVG